MSQNDPIVILDDDDRQEESRRLLEDEINRHNLLKATMGSRFDVIVAVLKIDMQGTQADKDRQIRSRIEKFFDYGEKKIDLGKHEHFFERMDLEADEELLAGNELVLFGVDFMNTRRIKGMFPHSEPRVVWLNDSHCKLVFADEDAAKEAIVRNLREPEALRVKMEEEETALPRVWFELTPYSEMGFERRLFARYAKTNEEKGATSSKNFQLFKQARRKFEEDMAKEIQPSLERHITRLGLGDTISKIRRTRASFRENETSGGRGRSRERSRERRGREGREERGWGRGRGNREGPRGWNRPQGNESYGEAFDSRPRRGRGRSPASSVSNYSYLLEQDPEDLERELNEKFNRIGLESDKISEIGKSEESRHVLPHEISMDMNDVSQFSMRKKKENNLSFSYHEYVAEQEEAEARKKNNVSMMVIDY